MLSPPEPQKQSKRHLRFEHLASKQPAKLPAVLRPGEMHGTIKIMCVWVSTLWAALNFSSGVIQTIDKLYVGVGNTRARLLITELDAK